MELIFVGTGSGQTSLNRFHSSLLFKYKRKNILVDSGDGISRALLSMDFKINTISDIILTHYHSDHLAGLPSLLTQMIIKKRSKPLKIYTHENLIEPLEVFLQISFIFLEALQFKVELIGFKFKSEVTISDSFRFLARKNSHIRNKHNIQSTNIEFISSSILIYAVNKKIVYTSDVGSVDDLYLFTGIDVNLFITESTHVSLKKLEDAIKVLTPKKTYITHLDNEKEILTWHQQLNDKIKSNVIIAKDKMQVKL